MRRCFNPLCSNKNCMEIQFCGESFNFNDPKNSDDSNQKDSAVSGNSSRESSSSESYDSDSSSGDSLFSSSSSASSASSSSEQVVPNLILRKKGRSAVINSKLNQKKEEKVVIAECNDPKCTDSNCSAQLAQSGQKCSDTNCTDKNCITSANSSLSPSCTDPHCSSCENGHHDHNSNLRNAFLGIAGVILLAMIGYMTYIKIKTKRTKNLISKVILPIETIQN